MSNGWKYAAYAANPLLAFQGDMAYQAGTGTGVFDNSVDMSPWDRQRAEVERVLSERPVYQTAYSGDWLKNQKEKIQLGEQNLLDENAQQAAAQGRSWWDQVAQAGGAGQGGDQSRMAYNFSRDQALGRQGILNQTSQQNIDAALQDYNLRAQDIAQRNAFDMQGWQTRAQTLGGLAQGEVQFRQTAPKKGFLANMFS